MKVFTGGVNATDWIFSWFVCEVASCQLTDVTQAPSCISGESPTTHLQLPFITTGGAKETETQMSEVVTLKKDVKDS